MLLYDLYFERGKKKEIKMNYCAEEGKKG